MSYQDELKSRGLKEFMVEYTSDGELWSKMKVIAKDKYEALSQARMILTDHFSEDVQQLKLLSETM
jgi:hypothetical protein